MHLIVPAVPKLLDAFFRIYISLFCISLVVELHLWKLISLVFDEIWCQLSNCLSDLF